MESYAWEEHTKVRSGATSPSTELDLLQDKYYNQFIQGIDNVRSEAYSPSSLSIVSASTGVSYSKPQTIRDSVFKPIREVSLFSLATFPIIMYSGVRLLAIFLLY